MKKQTNKYLTLKIIGLILVLFSTSVFADTHRISILGWSTLPDETGNVFFETYTVQATNDVWGNLVAIYNDGSTRNGIRFLFTVPKNYVGTANLVIVWTSTATTGDVEWDLDYRAVGGNDTESFDQTGTQESVNANDTAPSAAHERMEITIALTDANFSVDDTVLGELFRDLTDAGDTIADEVILFAVYFEYNDI